MLPSRLARLFSIGPEMIRWRMVIWPIFPSRISRSYGMSCSVADIILSHWQQLEAPQDQPERTGWMRRRWRLKKVAWTSRHSTPPREGGSLHENIRYVEAAVRDSHQI